MSVTDRVRPIFTGTAPARPLAIVRIVVAGSALAKALDLGPAVVVLAGGDVIHVPYADWTPAISVGLAWSLIALWAAAATAFLAGWRTRWAGAALTTAMAVVLMLDQQLYSNHFYLLILLCLLLTVADSGAALSLDARRHGERDEVPAWPVTLLKLQLSIVYGFAVLTKLNVYYLSGSVLNMYWVREGFFALPDGLRRVEVMFPLAILSLAAELILALALWIPRTRHAAFVIGLGLHLAIIPTMGGPGQLTIFAALMFALYLLFLDATPRSRLVVWDDECSFCLTWVRWFRRLDWLRVHRFVGSSDRAVLANAGITTEEADTAIQLVGPAGRRASGFRAVRIILEYLPLSFLWSPILRFAPIERLGERVYARVAARRKCGYSPAARAAVAEAGRPSRTRL